MIEYTTVSNIDADDDDVANGLHDDEGHASSLGNIIQQGPIVRLL